MSCSLSYVEECIADLSNIIIRKASNEDIVSMNFRCSPTLTIEQAHVVFFYVSMISPRKTAVYPFKVSEGLTRRIG